MFYDFNGNQINTAYDFFGNRIGSEQYADDYQKAIYDTVAEWKEADGIGYIISTDQHGYYNPSMWSYLKNVVDFTDLDAFLNFGDTCSGIYDEPSLKSWSSIISAFPRKIQTMGNHDVWTKGDSGSYRILNSTEFEVARNKYFDNSSWASYQNVGTLVETMVDTSNHIRYVTISPWDDARGYHQNYNYSSAMIDAFINYLSIADGNDVIILGHVNPMQIKQGAPTTFLPPVDGNEPTSSNGWITDVGLGVEYELQSIISARKNKASGTYTDANGMSHSYDFTSCNSDLICLLHGHDHVDRYRILDIPYIGFDAMGYETHPFFLVRIGQDIKVWKICDDAQVYKYSVVV